MRLLKLDASGAVSFTADLVDNIPPYAILSHTWGDDDEEVKYEDIQNGTAKGKPGYAKIQFCGQQAKKDGLEYFWVDTCCIKKSDSTELSEAINSMFRWYYEAAKCYVYLPDVTSRKRDNEGESQRLWEPAFRNSRWFTRGWTLQELLAPEMVEFFSKEEHYLGCKTALCSLINEITGIPVSALKGTKLSQFSVEDRMRWRGNRNTKKPEDKVYCLLGIFDVSMSLRYGEGEKAWGRLHEELAKSLQRQLDANRDRSFPLRNCESNDQMIERRQQLLKSLEFKEMDDRRATIKRAYSTTCKWLLEDPKYVAWNDVEKLDQHHGFLWVSGKPGAGKSTLLKFAHANAEKQKAETDIILSFFFNARGEELEKSIVGTYRAILFQLLNKAVDLQEVLDDIPHGNESLQHRSWTVEGLEALLSAAISRLGQRKLRCFIDALDEGNEEQVREMIAFFEDLGEQAIDGGGQVYVCFSSRLYPLIEVRHGLKLELEDLEGHGADMKKYVQSHLRTGKGKYVDEVTTIILEKANGVFMWLVLVVDILNKEFRQGRVFAVKKRLEEVPPKLSDLFRDILGRDRSNMVDFLLCLQWVLFARRPLTREEFYYAMVACLDPEPANLGERNPEQITEDDMNRFVLSSSKGLAELTKSKAPTVQFIHESVRDFLVKDGGMCELWPDLKEDLHSASHERLKTCCYNYFIVNQANVRSYLNAVLDGISSSKEANELRHDSSLKYPFILYASLNVLYHADEAAQSIQQQVFLEDFPLESWLGITNVLQRYNIRRHTTNASLIYILAEFNYARLLRILCNSGWPSNTEGERYRYPLFAALTDGHREAVRALLQQEECSSAAEDITAGLEFGQDFQAEKDYTPLLWAVARGHKAVANVLVESPDIDLNARDRTGRGILLTAVKNCHVHIAKWLLVEGKADVDERCGTLRTPLLEAIGQGQLNMVQLLLEHGANLELADKTGRTVLMVAAGNGHEAITQVLLNWGAQVDTTDSGGGTALIMAARQRNARIVVELLDRGASIDGADNIGRTALMRAISGGLDEISSLLLIRGARIEVVDRDGDTALSMAAFHGRETIVTQLLDRGANVGHVNESGETSLFKAAFDGLHRIARLFVDRGANVEAITSSGMTSLMRAAQKGHIALVMLLLDRGANINAQDNAGSTALILAARNGKTEMVQLLLDHGADSELVDVSGHTALHLALCDDCEPIVMVLLRGGAKLEAMDDYGKGLISQAYRGDAGETLSLSKYLWLRRMHAKQCSQSHPDL